MTFEVAGPLRLCHSLGLRSMVMRLLRLAQLQLSGAHDEPWLLRHHDGIDDVALRIQRMAEGKESPLKLVVMAEVDLEQRPLLKDGRVVVPNEERRRAEAAIERFADAAAVATGDSRQLYSFCPHVALTGLSLADREWLSTVLGFAFEMHHQNYTDFSIDMLDFPNDDLDDRPDGVTLLAEALSTDNPVGRFRELLRFLERAFATGPFDMVKPLSEFLSYYDRLEFADAEVRHWLTVLRHEATHADRRERFAVAADVEPYLLRLRVAAYDVLFNKATWRTTDSARRNVWTPHGAVLPNGQSIVLMGTKVELHIRMMDSFGAYTLDIDTKLRTMPQDWWIGDIYYVGEGAENHFEAVESLRSQG